MNQSSTAGVDCYLKEEYDSCWGTPHFEHEGNQYCVLHFPIEDKKDAFQKALGAKLKDQDFDFSGIFFPSGTADFRGAIFLETATFREAYFSGEAYFESATFSGTAYFESATFEGEADFGSATFEGEADFGSATFEDNADFWDATFGDTVYFESATFRGQAHFGECTFKESARFFDLRAFPSTALAFGGATIEKPERIFFHTTYLRPSWFIDVDAQKFDFTDVEWFRVPDASEEDADKLAELTLDKEIENLLQRLIAVRGQLSKKDVQGLRQQSLRRLSKSCRRLMNNAEENRDYPTANEFHYWSMEAQRKEGWSRLGLIATLYWALSRYGDRPLYTLGVLVVMWVTFAALYFFVVESSPYWVFTAADVWQVIDYFGQALVYSLSALTRLNPRPQSEELDWFQTLVTVEGILGPLQIALFLLAVRRKVMR